MTPEAAHATLSSVPATARAHILVVEDDAVIHRMVTEILGENGFSVTGASSALEMDRVLDREEIDLVVLDVMLPGEDGFSICRRLRASSNLPILMLTALGQEVDRVVGLEIGADDYVTKPFNSRELIARIRALLRRARAASGGAGTGRRLGPLRFAGWRLHPGERRLLSPDGVRVTTTSAEFDVLLAFCQHPGEVLSREQLLELTHGGAAGPIERSIDVHRIRQKIEPDPRDPVLIKTVRLGGYVFTPDVEAL